VPKRLDLDPQNCSRFLRGMADPERLRIIERLFESDRTVSDLAADLGIPLKNASHHLKTLRHAGLVVSTRRGRFVHYSLSPDVLKAGRVGATGLLDFGCCRIELGRRGI
jgi:DNA-binding transcriptional ArsR family regulator